MECTMSRPYLWRKTSPFGRLAKRLDMHPVMLAMLLACMGYVAILVAWCARHAAMGGW